MYFGLFLLCLALSVSLCFFIFLFIILPICHIFYFQVILSLKISYFILKCSKVSKVAHLNCNIRETLREIKLNNPHQLLNSKVNPMHNASVLVWIVSTAYSSASQKTISRNFAEDVKYQHTFGKRLRPIISPQTKQRPANGSQKKQLDRWTVWCKRMIPQQNMTTNKVYV
jgi:hypothetical protein